MEKGVKDKHRIRISDILKSNKEGLTIADIMKKTSLARNTVLTRLQHLIGEGKVEVRQINMAKVHYWKDKDISKPTKNKEIKIEPIEKKHITKKISLTKKKKTNEVDMVNIKEQIMKELKGGKITKSEAQIKEQREPITHVVTSANEQVKKVGAGFEKTGVPGFDDLFNQGIPKGSAILLAGGAGAGKTILALQILNYHASQGKKCLYMSFEESEEHLVDHMEDFGWNPKELIKKGNLIVKRFNPFDITRSVDALLMKAKGELLIDIDPIIFPQNFKPDVIILDSLTAIASAFTNKEDSYRIYVEQLFRFFEKIKSTSFLITETEQIPTIFSQTGVEEFLADGVIVMYNIKRGNIRENAIEVLKLRGAKHQKKIVAMQITDEGIIVYPEQEVFGEM